MAEVMGYLPDDLRRQVTQQRIGNASETRIGHWFGGGTITGANSASGSHQCDAGFHHRTKCAQIVLKGNRASRSVTSESRCCATRLLVARHSFRARGNADASARRDRADRLARQMGLHNTFAKISRIGSAHPCGHPSPVASLNHIP